MSLSFATAASTPTRQRQEPLTSQETELIRLVAEGFKDEQISARLGISLPAARGLIASVFYRLGVSDRLGLIIYAFYHGIAKPPR
ncbi:MAG: helix-turn-helix transcriptional regulator [Rubrivivax sp.]|nr:helix-turn-helix transcriptional regulator [Pyrinomonadaceae bacterium]